MNDDLDLITALKANDEEAWRKFIAGYRRPCYLLAKRYRCQKHFEDFFSELIVNLLKEDFFSGREDQPFEETVTRCFSNIISSYMHKAKRRLNVPVYEEIMTYPSASCLAEKEELYSLLEQARSELPGEEKSLVEDYFFRETTLREIAEKRGVHATTVMRRLRKICKKLEARIEGR